MLDKDTLIDHVALTQQHYAYRQDTGDDQVLHVLVSRLENMFVSYPCIHVYADLPGLREK